MPVVTDSTSRSRPTWDEYGLEMAAAVARRADCTRRQVGAVVMGTDHRIISTGYNGYPAGRPGCLSASACPRGRTSFEQVAARSDYTSGAGKCDALHGEENAIMEASRNQRLGATLYVTDQPCPNCARVIAGSGLARVVWPEGELLVADGTH